METTITKRLQGKIMQYIFFELKEMCFIKFYKAILKEGEEYNPENNYRFEIIIRHRENQEPVKLFNKAREYAENDNLKKVENIKKNELVKRTATAKKTFLRGDYNRFSKMYELQNYDDISDFIYVKKGTLLYTDWNTNEDL